jgi:hypothetical protein
MNARWGVQKMKYEVRLAAAVIGALLAAASTLSGCTAGRWFEQFDSKPSPPVTATSGLKLSTVAYIRQVCELPKDQRDPALRELNESLLPNHAVIYCGRGGTP